MLNIKPKYNYLLLIVIFNAFALGKHGSFKEYEQASKLFSYGLSCDKIADVLEKDKRTIDTWRKNIGEKNEIFHITVYILVGLAIEFLQMDELILLRIIFVLIKVYEFG